MEAQVTAGPGSVAVIGLGKIGLPLAVQYARSGWRVAGVDIDERVVDTVNDGTEPFPGEADLGTHLAQVVRDRSLHATADTAAAVSGSDVVVVVVPLLVDHAGIPDFVALDAATAAVGAALRPGTLILYETTLPVHTTRQRFAPALEAASGLTCGSDFFVAFSPERVYSGRIFADLRRYPKLVGGLDPAATARAVAFYRVALQFDDRPDLPQPNGVWDLGSAEAAELAKLAETTYRDINIAFANELAVFSESAEIDVFKVIEAANSQPFSHIHRPGIAVGGHCIPVYPQLLLTNAPDALVPAAARAANDAMPQHAVDVVRSALGTLEGARVVVLGAAYRGGVKESALSGAFPLVRSLDRAGAVVTVHDPLYSPDELRSIGFDSHQLGDAVDAAIVQADHAEYRQLTTSDLPSVRVLYDGRGITERDYWVQHGVVYRRVGRG